MRIRNVPRRPALAAAVAALTIPALAPGPAGAGTVSVRPGPTGEHCIARVVGQEADGRFELAPPECHASLREALASIDLEPTAEARTTREVGRAAVQLADFTLAIHYEHNVGWNPNASLTVVGADCLGGYIPLVGAYAAWNNRISSTDGNCPRQRHYDSTTATGTPYADTFTTWVNLPAAMNDKTSSVQYLSS